MRSFQDDYPETYQHCYGCGVQNSEGLQIRSFWDGAESVALFEPKPYHLAFPGFVYGGLLASLIDCHGTGTAAAATCREEGRALGSKPPLRFVTASLHVDFLAPTPLGPELEIRGQVEELTPKKVIVTVQVKTGEALCARGRVVAAKMPESMVKRMGQNLT